MGLDRCAWAKRDNRVDHVFFRIAGARVFCIWAGHNQLKKRTGGQDRSHPPGKRNELTIDSCATDHDTTGTVGKFG